MRCGNEWRDRDESVMEIIYNKKYRYTPWQTTPAGSQVRPRVSVSRVQSNNSVSVPEHSTFVSRAGPRPSLK